MNRERLLERFLCYVKIPTTANDGVDDYPSSAGQWELGKLLVAELLEIGLADAHQDEHGLVWATIPATIPDSAKGQSDGGAPPVIALNAHLDTSPEAPGENVRPQVIEAYAGGDIALPGDSGRVIRVAENPELADLIGATLITTDGSTLLGGDDKAGVAVIMESAAHLIEQPQIPHGAIRILFTCDEEIGRGVQHVDLDKATADVCYTLDGAGGGRNRYRGRSRRTRRRSPSAG